MQRTPGLVFITGASSGIGQALALRYLRAGWRVALCARQGARVQAWLHENGITPEQARVYEADVTQADAMRTVGQHCLQQQGVPDVVIANAGISVGLDTREFEDLEVFERTLSTNTLGLAHTFHPFITPMMQRGSGVLVGIASVAGIRGLPGHGAYCASKAAAIAYLESLRGDMRRLSGVKGVRVLTLCPGYVQTPLTSNNRYKMPFLLSPAEFADQAFQAIEHPRCTYRVIPWQMAWVARLLRCLPNAWFDKLLSGRALKPRRLDS